MPREQPHERTAGASRLAASQAAHPRVLAIAHGDFAIVIRDILAIDLTHVSMIDESIHKYSQTLVQSGLAFTSIGGELPEAWSTMRNLKGLCVSQIFACLSPPVTINAVCRRFLQNNTLNGTIPHS